jgi:hypothetical protein
MRSSQLHAACFARRPISGLTLALLLGAAAPAHAQTLSSVTPEVAQPLDFVVLHGSELSGVTLVTFGVTVGGVPNSFLMGAVPLFKSASEVWIQMPDWSTFNPNLDASPLGSVAVNGGAAVKPFYFLEATHGAMQTFGVGSGPASTPVRPVISFALPTGAPKDGNSQCKLRLELASPNEPAFLLAGVPDAWPWPFYSGGTLVINVAVPFLILGPALTDATGTAQLAVPIPASVGFTVAFQWAYRSPDTHALMLSNGLKSAL